MGKLICLDPSGDTKIIWDKDNTDEIEAAKATFKKLKDKGFTPYSVDKTGDKKEVITEFDKNAEKIIMIPRLVGG